VTSISWIPSEAVGGATKLPFERGIAHYDQPPPDVLDDLEAEGLIVITRPVHQATGLSYDQQYWSVEATDEGQDLVDGYPEYQPSPDEAADRTGA